jgi:hypothetical protein
MTDRTPGDIEREGFVRQTLVALTANMAAAYVHSSKIVNWDQIVHQAMEGTQKCWIAILEDRIAERVPNTTETKCLVSMEDIEGFLKLSGKSDLEIEVAVEEFKQYVSSKSHH